MTRDSDLEYVRAMVALFRDSGLTELSVRRAFGDGKGRLSVRLVRQAAVLAPARVQPPEAPPPGPEAAPLPAAVEPDAGVIPSPMVGTAYLSPEPGADPFVRQGATVRRGDTLLIVEAMKTMNFIEAPRDGTVQEMLVGDGEPVEYGTPLLRLG